MRKYELKFMDYLVCVYIYIYIYIHTHTHIHYIYIYIYIPWIFGVTESHSDIVTLYLSASC